MFFDEVMLDPPDSEPRDLHSCNVQDQGRKFRIAIAIEIKLAAEPAPTPVPISIRIDPRHGRDGL